MALGCVSMRQDGVRKTQNSIRMASGRVRVVSEWHQDGVRISLWRQDGVRIA